MVVEKRPCAYLMRPSSWQTPTCYSLETSARPSGSTLPRHGLQWAAWAAASTWPLASLDHNQTHKCLICPRRSCDSCRIARAQAIHLRTLHLSICSFSALLAAIFLFRLCPLQGTPFSQPFGQRPLDLWLLFVLCTLLAPYSLRASRTRAASATTAPFRAGRRSGLRSPAMRRSCGNRQTGMLQFH